MVRTRDPRVKKQQDYRRSGWSKRVTARKYLGDDAYSWAVFVDGRPAVTGLSRREVPYWRARLATELEQGR